MRRSIHIALIMLMSVLAACGRSSAPVDGAQDRPYEIASLLRSGGLQGDTALVRVYSDGTMVYGRSGGSPLMTSRIPPEQFEALQAALGTAEWQSLDDRYGGPVPDGYTYTIIAGGKWVETYDGVANPPALAQVLDQLNQLMAQGGLLNR